VYPVTTSAGLPPEMPPGGVTGECFLPGFAGGQFAVSPIWGRASRALGPECEVPRWPGRVERGRRDLPQGPGVAAPAVDLAAGRWLVCR
jgi:hypothetical protein